MTMGVSLLYLLGTRLVPFFPACDLPSVSFLESGNGFTPYFQQRYSTPCKVVYPFWSLAISTIRWLTCSRLILQSCVSLLEAGNGGARFSFCLQGVEVWLLAGARQFPLPLPWRRVCDGLLACPLSFLEGVWVSF